MLTFTLKEKILNKIFLEIFLICGIGKKKPFDSEDVIVADGVSFVFVDQNGDCVLDQNGSLVLLTDKETIKGDEDIKIGIILRDDSTRDKVLPKLKAMKLCFNLPEEDYFTDNFYVVKETTDVKKLKELIRDYYSSKYAVLLDSEITCSFEKKELSDDQMVKDVSTSVSPRITITLKAEEEAEKPDDPVVKDPMAKSKDDSGHEDSDDSKDQSGDNGDGQQKGKLKWAGYSLAGVVGLAVLVKIVQKMKDWRTRSKSSG